MLLVGLYLSIPANTETSAQFGEMLPALPPAHTWYTVPRLYAASWSRSAACSK